MLSIHRYRGIYLQNAGFRLDPYMPCKLLPTTRIPRLCSLQDAPMLKQLNELQIKAQLEACSVRAQEEALAAAAPGDIALKIIKSFLTSPPRLSLILTR